MDIQQNNSNFNSVNTQKAQINGLDTTSPVGFRHHLPQIATMARNPKIAQSKASAKTEVTNLEKATVHVEGVGSVLQIREEGMEVEPSPPKGKANGQEAKAEAEKLLESMEMMESEASEQVGDSGDALPSTGDKVHEEVTENVETIESDGAITAETEDTVDTSGTEKEQSETDVVLNNDELKGETETSAVNTIDVSNADKPLQEKPVKPKKSVSEEKIVSPKRSESRTRGRPRSVTKSETEEKTKESLSKADNKVEGTSTGTDLSSDEVGSPVGKRQRKPKKLDIEEVVDTPKPKTPKEKLTKPKLEVTPDLEAKEPGKLRWSTSLTKYPVTIFTFCEYLCYMLLIAMLLWTEDPCMNQGFHVPTRS